VRQHIIRMSTGGGCFIGASLSCADLLAYLYSSVLRISPETISDPQRDYLLLSKGHDVPALYGTLAELGFFEVRRLNNHLRTDDFIYWHPNSALPGVEFHSGSLGHLPSVAIGISLDIKLSGSSNRVFVILGDGELNEGSVWESCLVAAAHELDNLVAIVDRNGFQANLRTEELIPLEPLKDKFQSFGWRVESIDGHNFIEMESAFKNIPSKNKRPTVMIAHTIRGKGLPSIEDRADRWFVNFTDQEVEMLLMELKSNVPAKLLSEPQYVR
jgi:transketolase